MYFNNNEIIRLLRKKRNIYQFIKDRIAFPIICLISADQALRQGFTPLDAERMIYTLEYVEGKILDIGCGENLIVRTHGQGIGVDIYPWDGADLIVKDCANLPFPDQDFDTVSIVAALNHMQNREKVLAEAYRLLKPNGRILVTMINPITSFLVHRIRFNLDPDQHDRGLKENEVLGFWKKQISNLLFDAGFTELRNKAFLFGLNRVYIGFKQ